MGTTVFSVVLVLVALPSWAGTTVKINGSTTVNPVVVEIAERLGDKDWRILVDTQGGSSGGISYLAEGMADIGMSSRPVTGHDRKKFPGVDFQSHIIGYDGVALVVPESLYRSGVRALSREQIRSVYEGKVTNWKAVGGPDRRIVFFNKEPGRGTWEVFIKFLYGDAARAPKVFHPEVGANQEARTKVARHPGGITQLSASWTEGYKLIRPLALMVGGKPVRPDLENIRKGSYPMRRPLLLITLGKPAGAVREFIRYALSEKGQKIVQKYGYLPVPAERRS